MKEALGEAIARLPEREKLVVTLYYYEELTLREIGEVLGVTESRVSQLHTKAILRLKARLGAARVPARLDAGRDRAQARLGFRLRDIQPRRIRSHARSRARQDPQRRRRRSPRHGEDLARRGDALPGRRDEPARHDRGRLDGGRLGRRRAAAPDVARASLSHAEWQGRKINLVDAPGDPSFQGDARCALRVVEGALFVLSGVMGVEVGTARLWKRADELGISRVLFVNMLDRERADFFRALEAMQEQLSPRCVAVHLPIGCEHELTGIVDILHMCAYTSPDGAQGAGAGADPGRARRPRPGVPREAARRGRRDRRGADGAVPRGRGARRRGGRARAQGRGHPRRGLPGRVRRRDEEPRHARAARPARRGRALAGEGGLDHAHRGRRHRRLRVQDDRRPVRRPDQPLPRPPGHGPARPDARQRAHAREGAHGHAALAAGQGAHPRARSSGRATSAPSRS